MLLVLATNTVSSLTLTQLTHTFLHSAHNSFKNRMNAARARKRTKDQVVALVSKAEANADRITALERENTVLLDQVQNMSGENQRLRETARHLVLNSIIIGSSGQTSKLLGGCLYFSGPARTIFASASRGWGSRCCVVWHVEQQGHLLAWWWWYQY
jgi:hypothetical protein